MSHIKEVHITFAIKSIREAELHPILVTGREAISQLFSYEILFAVLPDDWERMDLEQIRGSLARLQIQPVGGDDDVKVVCGMIEWIEDNFTHSEEYRTYRARLVPRLYRATLVQHNDVMLDMSVPEVVEHKLRNVGLDEHTRMDLDGGYEERDFIVQYDETDLAFISRLTEHLGISYTIRCFTDDGARGPVDHLYFHDHNSSMPAHPEPVPFQAAGPERGIFAIKARSTAMPKRYCVQDYDWRNPTLDLTSRRIEIESGYAGGHIEYGSHFRTKEAADILATVRAEEIHCRQLVYTCRSTMLPFMAGYRFTLVDHPQLEEQELCVVSMEHRAFVATFGYASIGTAEILAGEGIDRSELAGGASYRNEFRAIPADRTYRPPRITPKPRISGFVTGMVQPIEEAIIGDSAELDERGQYRVKLYFDGSPRPYKASRRIRMMQPHGGANHGMHFPLRPGVEVAVGFANGDPDRPVILGALDNEVSPSVTRADNARQNIIRTHSGIQLTMRDTK